MLLSITIVSSAVWFYFVACMAVGFTSFSR